MAISITHATQATTPDDPQYEVGSTEWNAAHTLTGIGTDIQTFLETPSSSNLAAAVTGETGSGALVFGTTPTFTTSMLLSSGFAMNWNSGDVTLTHSSNTLTVAGGNLALASASNLHLPNEGVINWNGGDVLLTHTANTLTLAGGNVVFEGDIVVNGFFRQPLSGEATIASGVITASGSYHPVDTEADAASDDLDTINGGTNGAILTIRASDSGRTVVVKDGTGNLQIAGDMTLDNVQDTITLRFDSTLNAWLELGRAASGA